MLKQRLPEVLKQGEKARLLPIISDSHKEQKATSILLASLSIVEPFAKKMLLSVGQRIGTRTSIKCFTEVVFRKETDSKNRPDGLMLLQTGKRQWSALVESKIGNETLDYEQVLAYMQLAKINNIDAIITLSNQFTAVPTHNPVETIKKIPKNLSKTVKLYHWSWTYAATEASLLIDNDDEFDVEQRFILSELVRYFTHNNSGVTGFNRMNSEWRDLTDKIHTDSNLNRTAPEVINTLNAWYQEQKDLCLIMSRLLNVSTTLYLSRLHKDDFDSRLKNDINLLIKDKSLYCEMDIPNAASRLSIKADVAKRNIVCSMTLSAPGDLKRYTTRLNWLLKQLPKDIPGNIHVKIFWPKKAFTQGTVHALRDDPSIAQDLNRKLLPVSFEVLAIHDLGAKFSGPRTFIDSLEDILPKFYDITGQYLKTNTPSPPKSPLIKDESENIDKSTEQLAEQTNKEPPLKIWGDK